MTAWEKALEAIREAGDVVLFLHRRPDGDSVGSNLAMALALLRMGKAVKIVSQDPVPPYLQGLPGADLIRAPQGEPETFSLALALDCADKERTGMALPWLEGAKRVVNVDHHSSNTLFGHINVVDPAASATGELVYRLLTDLEVPLDGAMAKNLYVAILTDTGSFSFSNTTPWAHRIAAHLLEMGVRPAEVAEEVFGSRSEAGLRLWGRAIGRLQREGEGRLVWSYLSQEDFQELGVDAAEGEGIAQELRRLEGVEGAFFFREEAPGLWRVSLRSRGLLNVAELASLFGGGGHPRAAGLTWQGTLEEGSRKLLAEALRLLAEVKS
ncbi:MAG: bifunctional oligoribonuclease/PAP phosphatase NrnA [Bacillota bacterium]|nr:bifunctional oligoribonuclease/PAP phosphatase NrnA [Bacillota bacterium]